MDNNNKSSPNFRDGTIDFGAYGTEQLVELQSNIDPERFPCNYAHLIAELERRAVPELAQAPLRKRWDVRFSRAQNFWSWFQAKRRRQWFYGPGSLEVQGSAIALRGWQRTWLGMPVQGERLIPFASILNFGRDDATVMIQVAGCLGFRRKLEFDCDSVESAVELCGHLPPARDTASERDWQEMRIFHRILYAPRNYPWSATALVLLNVLAFLVFFFSTKSWSGVQPQLFTVWGSNYGPMTVGGQWWRLLSSLFLHLSPMHLVLNMWVLWNVGRLAERLFGHGVFLFLYFFTGIIAGLATLAWNPALNVVGASGPIFGILGAVLASVIRPSYRTPSALPRSHWLSLLVFTAFNLLCGFLQFGIANAAHVGGFVSGALLGGVIAIPRRDVERRYYGRRFAAAIGTAAGILVIALALTPGIGSQMAPTQHYWKSLQWFVTQEAENLREWQSLLLQAQAGSISDDALAQAFEGKILPFWNSAIERTASQASLPKNERAVARDVNAYATERRDWAKAIIDALRSNTSASASNMQFHLEKVNRLAAQLERRSDEDRADLSSRALVRSVLVARVRRILLPTPACVRSPEKGYFTSSSDLINDGPKRREVIGCSAQADFRSGDFPALEALFAKYPANYANPVDGAPDRYALQAGLNDLFEYGPMPPEEILVNIAAWRRQYRKSILPAIVEASAFSDWGWMARGHAYSTSVTPQQMQMFDYRNAMAGGVLDEVQNRSEDEPLWYTLSVSVRLDLGETRGVIRRVFEDGIDRFPNFLPLYRAELRALMPRWGGSYESVNHVIDDAASGHGHEADAQMYARLYWSYASLEGDDVDLFTDGWADWARMSEGFDLMVKQYPGSDYLINGYAYMACRAGDFDRYRALKVKLTARLSSTAWSERFSPAECDKKYADKGA
jgi:membrane associated rhomboid family serine protease